MTLDKAKEMNIILDDEQAKGVYSNLAIISHSKNEFVLDFASILPGMPKPKVRSRVILSAEHAKRLLISLQENVAKYESENGRIEVMRRDANDENNSFDDLGFNIGEA